MTSRKKEKIEDDDGFVDISFSTAKNPKRKVIQGQRSVYGQAVVYDDYTSSIQPPTSTTILVTEESSLPSQNNSKPIKRSSLKDDVPLVHAPEEDGSFLMHKVTGRETLQGLAVRYGVSITDLKKKNRLWTQDDIFARKELIIPISTEDYLKYQSQQATKGSNPSSSSFSDFSNERKKEMVTKFIEMTNCDEGLAVYFLEQKNFNFTKALGMFHAQASEELKKSMSNTMKVRTSRPEDIIQESKEDDMIRKKKGGSSPDLLGWDDAQIIEADSSPHAHANVGPAHLSQVNKKVQDRFSNDDEEMFVL